jgi:hypothetical protein
MSAARDKVIGSTIRNTGEMRRMATETLPTNSAGVVPVVRAALVVPEDPVELAVRVALVVPEDPVELAVLVALVVPEDPVELAVRVALVVPEDPAVRAGLVVSESPAVLVALAVPVAVLERELVQVEAAAVPSHPRAQLAVPLRTRLAIAPHPHDLVPLLEAGEDLAEAVAETTREPAVAEAVIAWEVADTVAVAEEAVAVAAVTAAAVAVAAAEDVAAAEEDVEDNEPR